MHVSVVIGTSRAENKSTMVAHAVAAALREHTAPVTVTSVSEHITTAVTVPPWGAGGTESNPTDWQALVQKTDVFVFVLPEYNHSFPGEWKLLMDTLYKEYAGKRAYVATVSGGSFAGVRVMEHVLPVLVNFKFTIGSERLHIAKVSSVFAADGDIVEEDVAERITTFAKAITA